MTKKKWIIWLVLIIAVLGISGSAYHQLGTAYAKDQDGKTTEKKQKDSETEEDTTTQKKAEDFTVYDENRNKVKLSDADGKLRIVNFWASWCPPCKREMPAFQKAFRKYGKKITFMMVNETDGERETMDAAQTFWIDQGYQMKILFDFDGDADNKYDVFYLPRTLFIDRNGNIVEDHVGEMSEDELTKQIKKLLNEDKKQESKILKNYKNVSITYTFGNTTQVLDNKEIMTWLKVRDSKVIVHKKKVQKYVEKLVAKYNTRHKRRKFKTTNGKTVILDQNEYGYQIDQEKEVKKIMKDIKKKVPVNREPVYKVKGLGRNGNDDLNGSYVEISLTKQHLWLYKDGKLVTQTDIISGLPTKDRSTCVGAWKIAYKASPYTLSSKEYGYRTKVQYWMPFVCGQGLHDADWQSEFGGDVYKRKGSHGCVNLPHEQARIIYKAVTSGYPVICY